MIKILKKIPRTFNERRNIMTQTFLEKKSKHFALNLI